tara:strand:+ start:2862 stop:3503 length:642 start_codon:yes stop_codon:yes gene_type:complete
MKVSVIVPAHNEAPRISKVLKVLAASENVNQIIVVDDGSRDGTAAASRRISGVLVLSLPENLGKTSAIHMGLACVKHECVLFVDADLVGLKANHIDSIIKPVISRNCDMSVGIFKGGKVGTDFAQKIAPGLSGQRAVLLDKIVDFPFDEVAGYGFETALNNFSESNKWKVHKADLFGVGQVTKEKKHGYIVGIIKRLKMYWEVVEGWLSSGKK